MVAVVLYAIVPAVRYAAHGVRSVNADSIEAGVVSGCTKRQLFSRVQLPLALSIRVITALAGKRDLGQEVTSP